MVIDIQHTRKVIFEKFNPYEAAYNHIVGFLDDCTIDEYGPNHSIFIKNNVALFEKEVIRGQRFFYVKKSIWIIAADLLESVNHVPHICIPYFIKQYLPELGSFHIGTRN